MPHTRRSGLRVYFRDVGDGPPLVLVHGYTGSGWSNWVATGWVDALAPERRLLIPDLRGHGRSQKPWRTEAYSIELLAADVVAAMDAAGIERPAIFGYSMGGMVAMHLLVHHQERFTRAVIGGMGSYFPPNRGRYVLDRPTRGAESGRWTLGRRARFLAGYASLPFYARMFAETGYPLEAGNAFGDALLDAIVVSGNDDAVAARLLDLLRQGLDELLVSLLPGPDRDAEEARLLALVAEVAVSTRT